MVTYNHFTKEIEKVESYNVLPGGQWWEPLQVCPVELGEERKQEEYRQDKRLQLSIELEQMRRTEWHRLESTGVGL